MKIKVLGMLVISISLLALWTSIEVLMQPPEVREELLNLLPDEREAEIWWHRWRQSAVLTLLGSILTLAAGLGMYFAKRWALLALCISSSYFLVLSFAPSYIGSKNPGLDSFELLEAFFLALVAAISLIAYVRGRPVSK